MLITSFHLHWLVNHTNWQYRMVLQAVYTAVALFVFLVCSQLPLYGIKTNAGTVMLHSLLHCQLHALLAYFDLLRLRCSPDGLSMAQAATPSTGRA